MNQPITNSAPAYTRADLATKSLDELKAIAEQLKIKPHHLAKSDAIISQILAQPQAEIRDAIEHPAAAPSAAPLVIHTKDQVLAAIKQYASKEGFEATFPGDDTWLFKYKGAEDSGHMSAALRVIQQRASFVARGRVAPRALARDGTYQNSYADTILTGQGF